MNLTGLPFQVLVTQKPDPTVAADEHYRKASWLLGQKGRHRVAGEIKNDREGPSHREHPLDPAPGTAPIRAVVSQQRGDS
jgi:hypothetical protein